MLEIEVTRSADSSGVRRQLENQNKLRLTERTMMPLSPIFLLLYLTFCTGNWFTDTRDQIVYNSSSGGDHSITRVLNYRDKQTIYTRHCFTFCLGMAQSMQKNTNYRLNMRLEVHIRRQSSSKGNKFYKGHDIFCNFS